MYHRGVLVKRAIEFLITNPLGVYVDATAGGGDHIAAVLEVAGGAEVIALDRDIDAVEVLGKRFPGIEILHGDFGSLTEHLDIIGVRDIDGILFDLGLSSYQIDTPSRGFSFDNEGPLDMRADRRTGTSAKDVLNKYSREELYRVFSQYGQISGSNRLAGAVIEARPLNATSDLRKVVVNLFGSRKIASNLSKVFQAIRIEVNDELSQLENGLESAHELLVEGGRMVVISYHSLEDRIVKRFMEDKASKCICPPDMPVCRCGKKATLKIITKKAIKPDTEEIALNSRARSAIMRVAERV